MNCALELGVREFRSLRREGPRLVGRRSPCVYIALPQGRAEQRLLDQARIGYSACKQALLVIGEPALELSRSLKLPCLTPFENNRLARNDAVARQVAAALIETVLPHTVTRSERCVMTAPGQYREDSNASRSLRTQFRGSEPSLEQISTAATLAQVVRLQGCTPTILSPSYATGLAELGRHSLTGIAMHFGAGECQASLLQQGREIIHVGISRGEDSLLDEWARRQNRLLWDHEGNCYLNQSAVRDWKEQARPSLQRPSDQDAEVWSGLVLELLQELIELLARELLRVPGSLRPSGRLPVVYAGSLCDAPGFGDLLEEIFAAHGCPSNAIAVRPAAEPDSAVVRGLLIYAEGMSQSEVQTTRPLSNVG